MAWNWLKYPKPTQNFNAIFAVGSDKIHKSIHGADMFKVTKRRSTNKFSALLRIYHPDNKFKIEDKIVHTTQKIHSKKLTPKQRRICNNTKIWK